MWRRSGRCGFVGGAAVVAAGVAAIVSAGLSRDGPPGGNDDGARDDILVVPELAGRTGQAVYADGELLADYRPTPQLVTPANPRERAKFPAVDVHCHWGMNQSPGAMLAAMNRYNLAYAVNLSGGEGDALRALLGRFDDPRFVHLCNVDFSRVGDADWADYARNVVLDAKAAGARGLKIFKSLGLTVREADGSLVAIDDPRLDVVWQACQDVGFPVLIHSGDPAAFFEPIDGRNERWMQLRRNPDWSFHGDGFPGRDEVFGQRDAVIERFPGVTFVAAHLGDHAEDLQAAADRLDRFPNLYLDLSGRVAELGRQPYAARRFLLRYSGRVLFGTDRYPGRPDQPRYRVYFRFLETADEYFDYHEHPFPPTGEWKIYGVFLPDDALADIYGRNAARLYGLALPETP